MSAGAMLPDFTEGLKSGIKGPSRRKSRGSVENRRETILSLVEMLLQNDDVTKRKEQQPSFEDDRDVPSVDEHLQAAGAEAFNKFSRRMGDFDRELRNFANAARQLGSSVAILSSAFHLRERVAQVLFLYRENAAALFPRKISRAPRELIHDPQASKRQRRRRRWRTKAPSHIVRPTVNEDLDVEDFPEEIECFAKDISTFLHCLNEFPEFTDEAVNASILSFERDLKYWASCLREYSSQFRNPAVQRYLHDISLEMGEHIDNINSTLSIFIEVGVPIIRFAQKHGATNLLNLSTVATFFSAVTATTMQFSFEILNNPIADAVNSFWFASLVFSIAAAVNSLLGLTWKQAMYRSPGDRVPWWVLIWIKRSPLVFLVLSVACFSIGLCFFAYASGQAKITCIITTVLTSLTSFGLCAVSAWFATERWIFTRYRGKKWLDDVLMEMVDELVQNRFIRSTLQFLEKTNSAITRGGTTIKSGILTLFKPFSCSCTRMRSDIEGGLPISNDFHSRSSNDNSKEDTNVNSLGNSNSEEKEKSPNVIVSNHTINNNNTRPLSIRSQSVSEEKSPVSEQSPVTPTTINQGRALWRGAMHTLKLRATIPMFASSSTEIQPMRQRTMSSSMEQRRSNTPHKAIAKLRLTELVPKLKGLEATQDLAAHSALVKHLQFSPDGKYLATSSWDRTSVIFKVGDPFVSHRVLAHIKGFVGQVAWSPDGQYLLTKMNKGIKVWTAEDGVCMKTIDREDAVEAVTWCHLTDKFLSVEGSKVYQVNLDGQTCSEFDLGSIKIHDVAVTPDDKRALAVGPLLLSPDGLLPSKSRVEKRLIVYNMESQQVECQVPVLNDVRDITLAEMQKNEMVALISYENKAPPQLWKLEILRDRETGKESSRLTLRHTYMPKSSVDFAGPSYFGGNSNELVLCAGKTGDIFIWDTEYGALLHHIRAQAHGGDLTCIAWNHSAIDPFMFATGSHDGTVRIWTKSPVSPDTPMDYTSLAFNLATFATHDKVNGYSMTSSPQEEVDTAHSGRESPDDDDSDDDYYGRERPKRALGKRRISFVSSNSSGSSLPKMR